MSEPTLLVDAVYLIAVALVYLVVARTLLQRQVAAEVEAPARAFALFWALVAAAMGVQAVHRVLAYAGVHDVATAVTANLLFWVLVCAAFAGLMYYVGFLFTGSPRWLVPSAVLYAGLYALVVYLIEASDPVAVEVTGWSTSLVFANPPDPTVATAFLLLLVGPVLVGMLAYASLALRVDDPTVRYRVALISGGFLVWFGSTVVASAAGISGALWWHLLSRALGLGAAVAVLLAYRPPRRVRRALGIRSMGRDETPAPGPPDARV